MFELRTVDHAAFSYYPCLGRVKQYVDQHYAESISLDAAAKVAGLTGTYFSTFFHAKTGIRFKDWLTRVRVAHAVELIEIENKSITAIAIATGFHSISSFERAFKKCTGMTPQAFKKSVRPCCNVYVGWYPKLR